VFGVPKNRSFNSPKIFFDKIEEEALLFRVDIALNVKAEVQ
jgi:hypothetical protein